MFALYYSGVVENPKVVVTNKKIVKTIVNYFFMLSKTFLR